jgi:flavodoxin
MKTCIIFYSYSGVTRGIAEKIRTACGGDLIEVRSKEDYSAITAYTLGCIRARREQSDPIEPEVIDVSSYDIIVVGTPVWAWKPAPATNAAIKVLKGCEGKKAVIYATCGSQAGETLPIMKKGLEEKGVTVIGEVGFTRKEVNGGKKIQELTGYILPTGLSG